MDPNPKSSPRDESASEAADRRETYYANVGKRVRGLPNADPTAAAVLVQLIYTNDVLETRLARYFNAWSLSLSAFNVLMILRNTEGHELPLHGLSELLLVSRANVTGLVDCLVARGLVERRVDERDRRVRIARLTDEGSALIAQMLPGHNAVVRDLCVGLSDGERTTLQRLLKKLRTSAEEAPP